MQDTFAQGIQRRFWFLSSPRERRAFFLAMLFISPWIIRFITLTAYPFFASLYFSMTDYDIFSPPRYIGLGNYVRIFTDDPLFYKSLYNTIYYAFFSLSLTTVLALTIAMMLNMDVGFRPVYRTIYYLPSVTPTVASTLLWMWLFNPIYGPVSLGLQLLGINPPAWFSDPAWAKPTLILLSLWGMGGTIVIYLAGLQDVPVSLLEAAELDGANWWQRIRNVTIPMISPVIFFNVMTGLIGSFQYFTEAFVMSGGTGGPADATMMYSLNLYLSAFRYFKMGYASALAWVLFLMILLISFIVWKLTGRHVYYGGG
ncbi:MAG: sugar ABC transporter permease [Anaerolineae bacterium]|nr:sugar ABC transporter permease [Anaerolineae bacterium]